jgi:hypothetical protein
MNLFKTTILVCITLLITNSKLSAQLYINEICASNDNINIEGIFPDWIELYNSSNSAINLNGYTATDKIDIPNLWTFPNISIPANSYLIIAANGENTGLQTNFSLSAGGEEIAIFNNQGVLIDHVVFGPQTTDVSYGRITDGATEFVYFTNPTLGISNNNAQGIRANNPEFSIDGGFYNSAVNLILSSNSSTARIFYTTDGSIPTQNSTEYIQPINISATTVIRAIVTDAGKANSTVSTRTYFLENRTFNLPVISISTDPDNFFGDRDGIYVEGTNGVSGYCMDYPVNWNQDWARPVSFEIYDVSGNLGVQVDAEAKIFGGCSRTNAHEIVTNYCT